MAQARSASSGKRTPLRRAVRIRNQGAAGPALDISRAKARASKFRPTGLSVRAPGHCCPTKPGLGPAHRPDPDSNPGRGATLTTNLQ